jgi:SAM-dependent methyltransferase
MLEAFRRGDPLPSGYGFRLDARVVEIPWALARLEDGRGRLLDAGSSLNHEFVLKAPVLADKEIIIVSLRPESQCHWRLGISYLYGDLRDLDFRDGLFDTIVCISTIEHVGMDNTMYGGASDSLKRIGRGEFLQAVRELRRVLRQGGLLYMTFPFGQYEDHGWFQQFDSQLTDMLVEAFGPSRFSETMFRYDPDGWRVSDRASCADCRFFDVRTSKYFDRNSEIEYPPDYPAGERAVACLELCK